MLRFDLLTCAPELLHSPLNHSIVGRAQQKGLLKVVIHNLRDYSDNKHRKTDDYPYGGGAGMVMTAPPIFRAIRALKAERAYDAVVFPTPDAPQYVQKDANAFSLLKNVIILCGHYKGVDERVRQALITHEFSLGDYVLTGGELAACVIIDSVTRLLPGVIGDEMSALEDSHQDGLLSPPVYTRPAEFEGMNVPETLLSGHQKNIEQWRTQQALEKTKRLRPDLYEKLDLKTKT